MPTSNDSSSTSSNSSDNSSDDDDSNDDILGIGTGIKKQKGTGGSLKKKKKDFSKILKLISQEIELFKKVLEGTNNIVTKDENNSVLDSYKKLVFFNDPVGLNSNTLYNLFFI